MEILTISFNYNPLSKDYDERGIGIYLIKGIYSSNFKELLLTFLFITIL